MGEVVASDLDDVVVETAEAIIVNYNSEHGTSMTLENFYSQDYVNVWGAPDKETAVRRVNAYLDSDEYFNLPPTQEAIDVIRELKARHTLYIVTGRPDFVATATLRWLDKHLPDIFEDVIFSNYFMDADVQSKGDICRSIGATVLIDDHLDHLQSAANEGIRGILFGSYPWNQASELPRGVARVSGWNEILETL